MREEGAMSASMISTTLTAGRVDATMRSAAMGFSSPGPTTLFCLSPRLLHASALATPDPATITNPVGQGNESLLLPSKRDSHFKFLNKARFLLEAMLNDKISARETKDAERDRPRGGAFHAGDGSSNDERPRLVNTMQGKLKVRTLLEAAQEVKSQLSSSLLANMGHGEAETRMCAESVHDRAWERELEEMRRERAQERKERAEEREALEAVYAWVKRADESWSHHCERISDQVRLAPWPCTRRWGDLHTAQESGRPFTPCPHALFGR